jgi:hypothetical protein
MAEAAQSAPAQVLGFLAIAGGARGRIPCFLKYFCVLFRFRGFLARCGLSNVWFFDEMQVFKTKAEVGVWLDQWAADNLAEANPKSKELLEACLEKLKELNGRQLLEHVTKIKKTDVEFNIHWTKDPTHVLGSSLYTNLREWLGAGKWYLSFCLFGMLRCGLGGSRLRAFFFC